MICFSHQAEQISEWAFCRGFHWEWKVVYERIPVEFFDVRKPFWTLFQILLISDMSEEKLCVSVHRGDEIRSGDNLANLVEFTSKCFWLLHAEKIEERMAWLNASAGEVVEITTMPLVREAAWVVWPEFTFEWPDGVSFFVTILVVIGGTLYAHVSNMLADL